MSEAASEGPGETRDKMRIDRALVYLRFARTRSAALQMIKGHALRLNRKHVQRASETITNGDVLTLVTGGEVRIIEILTLPQRRTSPAIAKCHYRELDRGDSDRKAHN